MEATPTAPTPTAPQAPAAAEEAQLDPSVIRKIEKGAEAVGTAIGLGFDVLSIKWIKSGKLNGKAGKIMGGIGGAFSILGGVSDGYKDIKCWKHPDNNRKIDDVARIAGDATQVAAGGIMMASIKKGPKALLTGVITGMAASALKLAGNLADDLPSNACQ